MAIRARNGNLYLIIVKEKKEEHNRCKGSHYGSLTDLPKGTDQRLWWQTFISTYMQFVASQSDPWDIPAALACEKLQVIWDAIFPDIDYTVTHMSTMYLLVSGLWD